jgi:hypothetical protein
MTASNSWFAPAPSELDSSRISIDFGLRSADLFFRELVVPELGQVWFVRQLSWPLAALAIHKELRSPGRNASRPTAIAHGIEALACKLAHKSRRQSQRILGIRAFGRDPEQTVWTFRQLQQARNYVRNTHRQAASRALRSREDRGLGFARGSRFDLLELEDVGRALAEEFLKQNVGQGGKSLRQWILEWISEGKTVPDSPATLLEALAPDSPTKAERDLVRSRILDTLSEASEKRRRLRSALRSAASLPDIQDKVIPRLRKMGYASQADEIRAALAFGAVLDRARDAVAALTLVVDRGGSGVLVTGLARDPNVSRAVEQLKEAARNFSSSMSEARIQEPKSSAFANAICRQDHPGVIRHLVASLDKVLRISDGAVHRGTLFRVLENSESGQSMEDGSAGIAPDRTGRTFRIANLHSLLLDTAPRAQDA